MSRVVDLVRNDTGPDIKISLTEADGAAVDLTGGSVALHFRDPSSNTTLFTTSLVIATPIQGEAIIRWVEGNLDVPAGVYEGEIEITRSTGTRETLFDRLRFRVREEFA